MGRKLKYRSVLRAVKLKNETMTEEAEETAAQIEYYGIAGGSLDCEASVVRLVLADAVPASCRIITIDRDHALLLTTGIGDLIAVKSGFASGCGGTGPNSF